MQTSSADRTSRKLEEILPFIPGYRFCAVVEVTNGHYARDLRRAKDNCPCKRTTKLEQLLQHASVINQALPSVECASGLAVFHSDELEPPKSDFYLQVMGPRKEMLVEAANIIANDNSVNPSTRNFIDSILELSKTKGVSLFDYLSLNKNDANRTNRISRLRKIGAIPLKDDGSYYRDEELLGILGSSKGRIMEEYIALLFKKRLERGSVYTRVEYFAQRRSDIDVLILSSRGDFYSALKSMSQEENLVLKIS